MIKPILKHYEELIVAWAAAQTSVRTIVIGGSTERSIQPADEWSDLDLEIYVTEFTEFLSNSDWLRRFGHVWTCLRLEEADGPVFLVLYDGGEKVDFHFYLVTELERLVTSQELHDSYYRGYRVALDKDNLAAKLPPPSISSPPFEKPSEEIFTFQVSAFWYGALYVAKQICRRNLWVVKFRDWTMKESLLKLIEWQARARHGWDYDTWHDGHFLPQWTDAETLESLQQAFGHFDAHDSWQALLATTDLFGRLGREVASSLEYPYPDALDQHISQCIRALHAADNTSGDASTA